MKLKENKKNSSEGKYLCVVNNTHGLMMYFLAYPQEYKDTIFITTDAMPERICRNLGEVIKLPSFEKEGKYIGFIKKIAFYWYYKLFFLNKLKQGAQLICGHDHLYFSGLFIDDDFICLEDGAANYLCPPTKESSGIKARLRKMLLGYSKAIYGYDPAVKKVILSGLMATPVTLSSKAQYIDMEASWQSATAEQKQSFLTSFGASVADESAKVMIITQPLSEYNLVSEEEKIRIYNQLYANYSEHYRSDEICIKPHPREKTDYEKHFPCKIIRNDLPAQILIFSAKPDVIASLCSSVGYNMPGIRIDLYGTSLSSELEKATGFVKGNIGTDSQ